MGYRVRTGTYTLAFDVDSDLGGLVVTAAGISLGEFEAIRDYAASETDKQLVLDREIQAFADKVKTWNLTDDADIPTPVTADGMKVFERPDILLILNQWYQRSLGVDEVPPIDDTDSEG